MKVIVHETINGVEISHLNWILIGVLQRRGLGWNDQRVEYEISKFTKDLFRSDDQVRPLMEGLATGGLTEDEAIEAIRLKDDPADCVGCHVIEDTELPAEQASRGTGPNVRDNWRWINGRVI